MVPRDPLPAPAGLKFITPPEVADSELGIEEAVAIALANQPTIQNRVGAYVAAQQRVAQALSPLLPQLSGQWDGFQNKNPCRSPEPGRDRRSTVSVSTSTTATVTGSLLLFDFGRPGRPRMRPRPTASSLARASSCRRISSSLAVKQS